MLYLCLFFHIIILYCVKKLNEVLLCLCMMVSCFWLCFVVLRPRSVLMCYFLRNQQTCLHIGCSARLLLVDFT
jgi:hypothetical protein